jgi:hypothetical protein
VIDLDPITQAECFSFLVDPEYIIYQQLKPSSTSTPESSSTKTLSLQHFNPVEMFQRGIKRDAILFPFLKDDKYHDI